MSDTELLPIPLSRPAPVTPWPPVAAVDDEIRLKGSSACSRPCTPRRHRSAATQVDFHQRLVDRHQRGSDQPLGVDQPEITLGQPEERRRKQPPVGARRLRRRRAPARSRCAQDEKGEKEDRGRGPVGGLYPARDDHLEGQGLLSNTCSPLVGATARPHEERELAKQRTPCDDPTSRWRRYNKTKSHESSLPAMPEFAVVACRDRWKQVSRCHWC